MRRVLIAVAVLGCVAAPGFAEGDGEKARKILKDGCEEKSPDDRAKAVQSLGLIPRDGEARKLALAALKDPEARVRVAGAAALGQMKAREAIGALQEAENDVAAEVAIAAADSLIQLGNEAGYELEYEVLTRRRKSTTGLMSQGKEIIHNPKELEKLGLEQGIGFIPYAGIALTAFRAATKDTLTPARAKAARALAKDPDKRSGQALVEALTDSKWLVRTAAAAAIAERNDPSLLPKVAEAMDDSDKIVAYTAAAAVVHLSDLKRSGATHSATAGAAPKQ